jgi:hypothetical protein
VVLHHCNESKWYSIKVEEYPDGIRVLRLSFRVSSADFVEMDLCYIVSVVALAEQILPRRVSIEDI